MLQQITVKIKKLFEDSILPERSFPTDSGLDLYAHSFAKYFTANNTAHKIAEDVTDMVIEPGCRLLVNTGISATVCRGFEIQIRPRSGLALKSGITVLNTPGTIDESYRGMIGVILINHTQVNFRISKEMKIAQMVVCPVILCDVEVVDDFENTERSAGGFGHTGV